MFFYDINALNYALVYLIIQRIRGRGRKGGRKEYTAFFYFLYYINYKDTMPCKILKLGISYVNNKDKNKTKILLRKKQNK